MPVVFNEMMKNLCTQSLQEEYHSAQEQPICLNSVVLVEDDISRLEKKIAVLPQDYKNILFCRYCFGFSAKDTAEVFEMENVTGQLKYIQNMLAFFMGIVDARIDDNSIKVACQRVLANYISVDGDGFFATPKYSARFRRKLRNIKATQKLSDYIMRAAKHVAMFLLICSIGFSTVLVVNAEAREQFFAWVVETFPQFSAFVPNINGTGTEHNDKIESFSIDYVPEGFSLFQKLPNVTMVSYEYRNTQGERISIGITSEASLYLNTEGAEIRKIQFKGEQAFVWEREGEAFFVWKQDGFYFDIIGDCSLKEVQQIAEGVRKK